MSYFRRPMGDTGPVTSPSQVDDTNPSGSVIVGEVPPTRVDCTSLAPDSPWRQPGQVCAPSTGATSLFDYFKDLFNPSSAAAASSAGTPTVSPTDSISPILFAGAAIGAYYWWRASKKKRS